MRVLISVIYVLSTAAVIVRTGILGKSYAVRVSRLCTVSC
jgi:hypothetical protein